MARTAPRENSAGAVGEGDDRSFPLNRLAFPDRVARRLRAFARAWMGGAIATLAVVAAREGVPSTPDRAEWAIYARLGLLLLAVAGAAISWWWEGAGAVVTLLCAAGLGGLSAAESLSLGPLVLALLFLVPTVMFWLVWQRAKPAGAVAALALGMSLVLAVTGYAANRVYGAHFAPLQPESATTLAPATLVEWIWAGGTTSDSVVVKAGLAREAPDARLLISERHDLDKARAVSPDITGPTLLAFSVDGLASDTDYWYAIEAGGEIDTGRIGHVRTFPTGPASFTFAFGACASTGSNGVVFDTIREHEPLFFLSTGDFHYENIDVNDPARYRAAFDEVLASPAQSALYRSASIAYVWDDHDYGPNDSDRTAPGREAAIDTYDAVVPHYPLAAGPGKPISQAFTVGRVRFIVTDTLSSRSPISDPDGPDKTMLGAEQQAWLEQELLAASGVYPVIVWVNSQPWIEEDGTDATAWGAYATERREIADFIVENDIQGLVMLSGDAHMVAIDDGSNNTFASDGEGPGFPVFHAAALDRHGSEKGGPYSEGTSPGGGRFGLMMVNDDGGDTIEIVWSGRNHRDEELLRYRFTVSAAGMAP